MARSKGKSSMSATVPVAAPSWAPPLGVVIDGVVYPLEGQPPVAVSHGWGDLSWLVRRWFGY
jgi:hypothetical protein